MAPPTTAPPSLLKRAHAVLFWAAWSMGAIAATTHLFVGDLNMPLSAFHAVAGYAWVIVLPLLAWSLLGGRRQIGAALSLQLLTLLWVLPGHWAHIPDGEPTLRLLSANLLMVHRDPERLIDELVSHDPDIMLLQEVSHHWARTLVDSPALAQWPHRTLYPQDGSFGVAVLSKHPVSVDILDLNGVPMAQVDLSLNGRDLRLYNVHTLPPRTNEYTALWQAQMHTLAATANDSVPTIIAGDFNTTRHNPSHSRLLRAGFRDAHAVVGRASAHTWPNGVFPLPPLRLDHIFITEDVAIYDVYEGDGHGSDHSPVIVDLSW